MIDNAPPSGWICFDGDCGVCRALADRYRGFLEKHGFGIVPLQESWVRERFGLPENELLHDIRLIRADGSTAAGPEVYRQIFRSSLPLKPIAFLMGIPGLRLLFAFGYRTFADNRHRFSKTCGFPPK